MKYTQISISIYLMTIHLVQNIILSKDQINYLMKIFTNLNNLFIHK